MSKVVHLPAAGTLLVCTDLQGNLGDFERMVSLWRAEGDDTVLVFTGDLVHGPSPDVVADWPPHLGTPYADESAALLRRFEALRCERLLSLMGNHEHAHVGGPKVPKFYDDEAAVLDAALGADRDRFHALFRSFPLIAVAPCGVVLTHAAPLVVAEDLAAYERLDWAGYQRTSIWQMAERDPLGALLWARGCPPARTLDLLEVCTGARSGVVVNGHDVVREGYLAADPHRMVVSTSFALFDERKVYLRLDLSARYERCADLRAGVEILPLHDR